MTLLDYANWVPLPPPVTTGSAIQSFADPTGEVWVAKNGVRGGAWLRARDALRARMYRAAAYTTVATTATRIPYDSVTPNYDLFGLSTTGASAGFTVPIAGMYRLCVVCHLQGAATAGRTFGQLICSVASTYVFGDGTQAASSMGFLQSSLELLLQANETAYFQYSTAVAQPFYAGNGDNWCSVQYMANS